MYSKEQLLEFYRTMVRIRTFEEKAAECFTKGMLAGNIHLSIGQEAAEAGAFAAIGPQDYFTSTHRGHGHAIARGADPKLAMAELFGKKTGYCKGKGGSMHIADMEKMNHLGANGIVGGGQPISAGSALASKILGDGAVTVGCFGDGATNEGSFHESLNMAAAWQLPMVWFIENNCYGVSTEIHRVTNTSHLASRAEAYGVPYAIVDGTNPTLNSGRMSINLKPLEERDDRAPEIIRRLNDAHGTANTDTSGYHHTITIASIMAAGSVLAAHDAQAKQIKEAEQHRADDQALRQAAQQLQEFFEVVGQRLLGHKPPAG